MSIADGYATVEIEDPMTSETQIKTRPAVFVRLDAETAEGTIAELTARLHALGYAVVALVEPGAQTSGILDETGSSGVDATIEHKPGGDSIAPLVAEVRRLAEKLPIRVDQSWVISHSRGDVQFMAEYDRDGGLVLCDDDAAEDARNDPFVATVVSNLSDAIDWVARHTFDSTDESEELPSWLPVPSPDQGPPFFIVGAERSGTTLLRLILSSHPQIACHSEFEYAVDWQDPETQSMSISEFTDRLVAHRKFPVLYATRSMLESAPQVDVDYASLTRGFLEQFRRENQGEVVGATVHRHFDRVLAIWPDARFIHIFRDPRDVARSHVKMGWAGTPYHGVDGWIEAERLWQSLAERIGPERFVDLRYESLIESPERELTRLCEFVGLDYSEKMLDYHETSTYQPLDPKLTYQWKGKMDDRDVRLVETRLGEMLDESPYERSGLPPLQPTGLGKYMLDLRARFQRWRWRIREYGFGLLLRHAIAKRIGAKGMRDRTRREIQDIDAANLK